MQAQLPAVGDLVGVKVIAVDNTGLIAELPDGLEAQIPFSEISWESERPADPHNFVGKRFSTIICEVDTTNHVIRTSIRQMTVDRWPELHKRFPVGTKIRGPVIEIDRKLHFVRVQLAEGISGIIPAESMREGGYEYQDFESTMALGQSLDVVVTKVFISKRRIRLDLARNENKKQGVAQNNTKNKKLGRN